MEETPRQKNQYSHWRLLELILLQTIFLRVSALGYAWLADDQSSGLVEVRPLTLALESRDAVIHEFPDNGSHDIWLMNADGTKKRPPVSAPKSDEKTPAFSGDGSKVIFFSNRDGTKWSLYTIAIATGKIERLTTGAFEDKHPQFTEDGTEVIFHSSPACGPYGVACVT